MHWTTPQQVKLQSLPSNLTWQRGEIFGTLRKREKINHKTDPKWTQMCVDRVKAVGINALLVLKI